MKTKRAIFQIIIVLLVVMFLHTGISKFLDFQGFIHDLDNQPFPDRFTPYLAWGLPIVEILIVMLLCSDRTRLIGLYASLILMTIFTVYTAMVLLNFFDRVPCSCGGVVSYLNWPQHLFFNIFFVAITFIAILYKDEIGNRKLETFSGQPQ
jgi:putative oxidoreductase